MKINHIKELAEIIAAHGLTALEVSEGRTRIRLEKGAPAPQAPAQPAVAALPTIPTDNAETDDFLVDFNHLFEVRSPMVGVFYAAASPDSEPFVSIGGKVKKGDVLCIIETMKLMNEILAEQDGEIVDICIKNGDIAEFGQVLFKLY